MAQKDVSGTGQRPETVWPALIRQCRGQAIGGSVAADAQCLEPADVAGLSAPAIDAALSARYAPLTRPVTGRPRVVAQLGQSLDGRIATPSGHSHYVTGEADRAHLHRLRALCDAVLVGAGTVVADDPQLTVRAVSGPNPTRVVVISRDHLTPHRHVFADGAAPTWAVTPPTATAPPVDRHFPLLDGSPAAVLECLSAAGIRRLLVEGGAQTVSAWLAAGLVDSLYLVVAPVIIGSGPTGLNLPTIDHMDQAWRPTVEPFALGADRLYRLDFNGA